MIRKLIPLSTILLIFITSCNTPPDFVVDISHIEDIKVNIKRYDKALFGINPDSLRTELNSLKKDFDFFIGDEIDTFDIINLYNYLTDPTVKKTFEDASAVYHDLGFLEKELSEAFRYMKYYFPNKKTPEVYTYISGFDFEHPIKYVDSVLIIALDMYLGKSYYFYPMLGIPDYKSYRMRKESIVVDCVNEIGVSMLPISHTQMSFLDKMIYEGKILYFKDIILPLTSDSLKIGYTKEQLDWCIKNEAHIWGFFLEQDFLYSNDRKLISRFMDDGPYTQSFDTTSPARTGAYIGWQIVRAYMRNTDSSIEELLKMNDSQQILKKSKYKPKK